MNNNSELIILNRRTRRGWQPKLTACLVDLPPAFRSFSFFSCLSYCFWSSFCFWTYIFLKVTMKRKRSCVSRSARAPGPIQGRLSAIQTLGWLPPESLPIRQRSSPIGKDKILPCAFQVICRGPDTYSSCLCNSRVSGCLSA